MIMTVIWKRINDTGKNWRHVYKVILALSLFIRKFTIKILTSNVMEFLIICGDFISQFTVCLIFVCLVFTKKTDVFLCCWTSSGFDCFGLPGSTWVGAGHRGDKGTRLSDISNL